jgi:hypothetical protein
MSSQQTQITGHSVETPSGRISYATAGTGPVALFVHGVLLNKHLWRHQLAKLSDIRHCIAVDLLAHGETEITPNQDVSVDNNHTRVVEPKLRELRAPILYWFKSPNPEKIKALYQELAAMVAPRLFPSLSPVNLVLTNTKRLLPSRQNTVERRF